MVVATNVNAMFIRLMANNYFTFIFIPFVKKPASLPSKCRFISRRFSTF